jgi:hypothetical protein
MRRRSSDPTFLLSSQPFGQQHIYADSVIGHATRRFHVKFASWDQTRSHYPIRLSDAATHFAGVIIDRVLLWIRRLKVRILPPQPTTWWSDDWLGNFKPALSGEFHTGADTKHRIPGQSGAVNEKHTLHQGHVAPVGGHRE